MEFQKTVKEDPQSFIYLLAYLLRQSEVAISDKICYIFNSSISFTFQKFHVYLFSSAARWVTNRKTIFVQCYEEQIVFSKQRHFVTRMTLFIGIYLLVLFLHSLWLIELILFHTAKCRAHNRIANRCIWVTFFSEFNFYKGYFFLI